MDVMQDILDIDELAHDPQTVLSRLRQNRRPMVIVVDGKPEAVLLATDMLPTKQTAIQAACELVTDPA